MSKHEVTSEWSAAIAVETGDVVQNIGLSIVMVCAESVPDDDDSIEIDPRKAIRINTATQIRVRCRTGKSEVKVVGGL